MSKRQENKSQLIREIEKLKPHDHLCLIYESEEEWKEAAIPYISIGLESGQKCIYVCDNHTASNLRQLLEENGTDVSAFESSGQLVITQESDTYTRGGKFDPDLMIELLIAETNKALSHGYSALRVTGEMTWVLKGRPGS
ncbi:MAG: MEDS domain-containing protein, partial [Dehalococcoidales bacterium]